MATSRIDGLASGLDTAAIIDSLMQLEAQAQNRLMYKQASEKSKLMAFRALNTDTTFLRDKAAALAKPATWQTVQGTVTGAGAAGMSLNVLGSAVPSTFSVTVQQVATNHRLGFTDTAGLNDIVVTGPDVKLTTHDGTEHILSTGDGTLSDLVSAINAASADTGVRATAVKAADGYRLLVQSTETGAETSFTLTNADDSPLLGGATVSAGTDAQISLGAGITVTSASNKFQNLVPGVDLSLDPSAAIGSTATVTVAQDPSKIATSVKELVTQLNALLTSIDEKTASATATGAGGPLSGNSSARGVRSDLLQSVFGSSGTMASVGIQTDRYGKLVFDEAKFKDAFASDPEGVAAMFTSGETAAEDGWAARLQAAAATATDRVTGTFTKAIESGDASITRFTRSIEEWDTRLELRRSTLERQYAALETALSSLQSQGSWLGSQIAGLPTWD